MRLKRQRTAVRPWIFQEQRKVEKLGTDGASWYVGWRSLGGSKHCRSFGPGTAGKDQAEAFANDLRAMIDYGTSSLIDLKSGDFAIEPVGMANIKGNHRGIYFLEAAGLERIKIGFSADLDTRLRKLQTACPVRLYVLLVITGTATDEKTIHERFADARIHGEWFQATPKLKKFILKHRAISTPPNAISEPTVAAP